MGGGSLAAYIDTFASLHPCVAVLQANGKRWHLDWEIGMAWGQGTRGGRSGAGHGEALARPVAWAWPKS